MGRPMSWVREPVRGNLLENSGKPRPGSHSGVQPGTPRASWLHTESSAEGHLHRCSLVREEKTKLLALRDACPASGGHSHTEGAEPRVHDQWLVVTVPKLIFKERKPLLHSHPASPSLRKPENSRTTLRRSQG